MEIFKNWTGDIPQQFQGKKNISILIRAFSRQIEEILQVFTGLETKTSLEMAEGKNLDYAGSIAAMSRKDAHIVLRKNHNFEITDDVYRKVLLWKLIKNTSDCTYEDIMGAMSILWNTDNINYVEDPERPATIILKMPTSDIDGADLGIGRVLSIKPAGIAVIYFVNYYILIIMYGLEEMDVTKISMRTQIAFWGCRLANGSKLVDGSALLDAKRRYDLILGIRNGIKTYTRESMDIDRVYINILSCFNVYEKVCTATLFNLGSFYFDTGNKILLKIKVSSSAKVKQDIDAKHLINGSIKAYTKEKINTTESVKAAINQKSTTIIKTKHMAVIKTSWKEENFTVTYRRNLHYFDGSDRFDGSSLFNAFYKKEEL